MFSVALLAMMISGCRALNAPTGFSPPTAGYYRLSELTKRLYMDDGITLKVPDNYGNLPVFVSSTKRDVGLFISHLAQTFNCSVSTEDDHIFRAVPNVVKPISLTVAGSTSANAAPVADQEKALADIQQLDQLRVTGQAHQGRWTALAADLLKPLQSPLVIHLKLDNAQRCGFIYFCDRPNAFELKLSDEVSQALRGLLLERLKIQDAIEDAAQKYPGLDAELGLGAGIVDPSNAVVFVRISTLDPEPDLAQASLCTPDGHPLVSADITLEATNRDIARIGLPLHDRADDDEYSAIARSLFNLHMGDKASPSGMAIGQELRGRLATEEPLNISTGNELREWAQASGSEIFARLPDAYFVERFRASGLAAKTTDWFASTVRHDPYITVTQENGVILVRSNGSPITTNVDRSELQTNLAAWQLVGSTDDLVQRATAMKGPWRLSPEAILGPILMNRWDAWFDTNVEALRVVVRFGQHGDGGALSSDDLDYLFQTCRWWVGFQVLFSSQVTEVANPPISRIELSRLLGAFDEQDRVWASKKAVTYFDPPQSQLTGIAYTRDLSAFASLRAFDASKWSNLEDNQRQGHYVQTQHQSVLIGKPLSPGLIFSIDLPATPHVFDVVSLVGLPNDIRAAIEAATPPGTVFSQKP